MNPFRQQIIDAKDDESAYDVFLDITISAMQALCLTDEGDIKVRDAAVKVLKIVRDL